MSEARLSFHRQAAAAAPPGGGQVGQEANGGDVLWFLTRRRSLGKMDRSNNTTTHFNPNISTRFKVRVHFGWTHVSRKAGGLHLHPIQTGANTDSDKIPNIVVAG